MQNNNIRIMPCSTCSKTAHTIKKVHRYTRTDKVGHWFICDTCGVTETCYPAIKGVINAANQ